jgi:RHS repeat-associated protein
MPDGIGLGRESAVGHRSVKRGFQSQSRQVVAFQHLPTAGGNVTQTYGYDVAGNQIGVVRPNGVNSAMVFDRAGRLSSMSTSAPAGLVASFSYVRDANGNPISIGGAGIGVEPVRAFTYDTANRLTQSCLVPVSPCPTVQRSTWSYDQVGNRLSERVGAPVATVYSYDGADQLASTTQGAVVTAFSYDANGNQLSAGPRLMSYNAAMQTVSVSDGGVTTGYSYDGSGNRIGQSVGAVSVDSWWDSNSSLPVMVKESSGVSSQRFVYGQGDLLALQVGGSTDFFVADELGSVTHTMSSAGVVQRSYAYGAYGGVTGSSSLPGALANPFKFTGQYQNSNGTYHLRARQYNPSTGSFTQVDPMPYGAGSAYESAYVYAGARPTVMVDPSGLRGRVALQSGGGSNPVSPQPTVQTWSISPASRDWGRFELRAFISTAASGGWLAESAGDNRSFTSSATCADSRACISVDFQAGTVRLEVNTSCNKSKSKCVAPSSHNSMNVSGSSSSLKLDYHLTNPKAPLGDSPAIDGTWRFSEAQFTSTCMTRPGNSCPSVPGVKTSFDGDAYPSWEVYHYSQNPSGGPQAVMQMRETAAKLGTPAGLIPVWPNKTASQITPKQHP